MTYYGKTQCVDSIHCAESAYREDLIVIEHLAAHCLHHCFTANRKHHELPVGQHCAIHNIVDPSRLTVCHVCVCGFSLRIGETC